MRVLKNESEFPGDASVVALGTFDGVHFGHRALILQAVERAQALKAASVVYTFDRNPLEIICPQRAPEPLMNMEEKLNAFDKLGVEYVIVRGFDAAFSHIKADDFLRGLVMELKPRAIVVGYNYSFGANGAGDAGMLCRNAKAMGYEAIIVPPVLVDGQAVSSTLIRALLAQGQQEKADRFR